MDPRVAAISKRVKIAQLGEDETLKLMTYYNFNPADFISDVTFTFDPRLHSEKVLPFTLFERQREYIKYLYDCYEQRDDGLVEKSRDVGLSWLNAGFTVWLFIFRPNAVILWGANRSDLVDKLGDMSSLLERMAFMLRMLPNNIRPEYKRNVYKILNLDNGSQITGEGGANIGRGGRSSVVFLDEAAFIEGVDKVDASLSMNTDCQIWVSTPNGKNLFYRKRKSGAFKIFTFQWFQDPRKDQSWFDYQKSKLEPHIFAQEVLISYDASVEDTVVKAEWVAAAQRYRVDPSGSKVLGYDIADEGKDKFAIVGRWGSSVISALDWDQMDTHSASTRKAWIAAVDGGYNTIYYDSVGVGVGAKVEFEHLTREEGHNIRLLLKGINAGSSPTPGYFMNTKRKNKDLFYNLKAELWWRLRRRLQNTYEFIEGGIEHPEEEMLSLHDVRDHELCSELMTPKFEITENGKIAIESKKNMRKRGVDSPNLADALVLTLFTGVKLSPVAENPISFF